MKCEYQQYSDIYVKKSIIIHAAVSSAVSKLLIKSLLLRLIHMVKIYDMNPSLKQDI